MKQGTKLQVQDLYSGLNAISGTIQVLSNAIVVHKAKFQYACIQYQGFIQKFGSSNLELPPTPEQVEAYTLMIETSRQYVHLFSKYDKSNFNISILKDNCNQVAAEFCGLARTLNQFATIVYPDAAASFDPMSDLWIQYHILDLDEIRKALSHATDKDSTIKDCIRTIEEFIKKHESEFQANEIRTNELNNPIPIFYQNWKIDPNKVEFGEEIGSGISCVVSKGFYDKQPVAIKRLKYSTLEDENLDTYQREFAVLSAIQHPCVLKFIGATDTKPFLILTELMSGKSLYHKINKIRATGLTPDDATMLTIAAFDIARGMRYLHKNKIVHRDLKSLNVLLDENGFTKICDFGLAGYGADKSELTKSLGTPYWMAPELFLGESSYSNKVDVYSYGIILWELVNRQTPYNGMDVPEMITKIITNDIRPEMNSQNPGCSKSFRRLIEKCWNKDPDKRPSFNRIVYDFSRKKDKLLIDNADKQKVREYIEKIMALPSEHVHKHKSKK